MNSIKKYREEKNITQEEMAKRLGISQQAYSRKERGERKFLIDEGFVLEETLNVPLRELFKELD